MLFTIPADAWFDEKAAAEAARALALAVRPQLAPELPVKPLGAGKHLTGSWDVIPFDFAGTDAHNLHPHISIVIRDRIVRIRITLPDKAKGRYWNALRDAGAAGLGDAVSNCSKLLNPARRHLAGLVWEPTLTLHAHQRHYRGPSDHSPVRDGYIEFDTDVLIEGTAEPAKSVKTAANWLTGFHSIVTTAHRDANVELALAVRFPNHALSVSSRPDLPATLVVSAKALRPFLDLLTR